MDKLGNLLARVVSRQPGLAQLAEHRLRIAFRDVVGDSLAAGCESIEVRGTTHWITHRGGPALATKTVEHKSRTGPAPRSPRRSRRSPHA